MERVCLVIGAGAGIGGNVARRFAQEGYHACLCRRSDEDGLNDLIVLYELGYMPIAESSAQLLFQALSERHERGSVIVNSNLAFGEWAQIFKSERLAVALLDRITHRAHVLEMNGDSYRLASARKAKSKTKTSSAT